MSSRLFKDQSFIDVIYHKIRRDLTMQETEDNYIYIFFGDQFWVYHFSKTEEQS